jgi:glycosyltransferase involved in cell wall biosynthesis
MRVLVQSSTFRSTACGTPVVATHVGGTSEIVRHGVDGLLVPYGNASALTEALGRTLDTAWDRIELSRRGLTFDWAESVEHSLDELNLALKESR